MNAEMPPAVKAGRRRALFLGGWLASAVAVGAGAGFGILAVTGKSDVVDVDQSLGRGLISAPSSAPSPTEGGALTFLLPVPDGYKPGPDEGELGNDSALRPEQADSAVKQLFGTLPAADLSAIQDAVTAGHTSGGAVRTYTNEAGTLDMAFTVLQWDPASAATSMGDVARIMKQAKGYRAGPAVPGHSDALCVLPMTRAGDPLETITCLGTVGDTFAVARAEGVAPLDSGAVTGMFGRQLDLLKDGQKT